MRLLLDEHSHRNIAPQLRDRGHDVVSVIEEGLRGASDDELFAAAAERGRAIVTNNVGDFAALERRWAAEGRTHSGLVYTSDASLPRSGAGVGEVIRRLERELDRHPADNALAGTSIWLAG